MRYDTDVPNLRATSAIAIFALGVTADAAAQLRTQVYAAGLTSPVAFVQDPLDRTVQYVVEQGGRIRPIDNGNVLGTDFLDLTGSVRSGGEQGLLGLAFAPDYAASGRFYVNFTNTAGHTVVARFRRSTNPLIADRASRFDLRWGGPNAPALIEQPFANHNGGNLVFGPDGFLYIGLGDGGDGVWALGWQASGRWPLRVEGAGGGNGGVELGHAGHALGDAAYPALPAGPGELLGHVFMNRPGLPTLVHALAAEVILGAVPGAIGAA